MQFELTWSNVCVSIENRKRFPWRTDAEKDRAIISSASGRVKNGSLVAVMGPSGAGKTTLLATLGGRVVNFRGSVEVNGKRLSSHDMKAVSGFMSQFFITTESLTVKEHLMFMMALKARLQPKRHKETLESLIIDLGLEGYKDTEIRYLSGGERKKVSLATEILNDPLILYCDEPTTGLDSTNALAVMQHLRARSITGKIVIFTIHQPSSQLYNDFDDIILLAHGRIVFQGSKKSMEDFFNSVGLVCPKSFNPAEFYVKYLTSSTIKNVEELRYKAAPFVKYQEKQTVKCSYFEETLLPLLRSRQKSNALSELKWLIWRWYINGKRNVKNTIVSFLVLMTTAIMMSIVFYETQLNSTGVQNFNGALYFASSQIIYSSMFSVLYTFPEEYSIFLAEDRIYSPYTYFISKVVTLVPKCVIFPVSFFSIIFSSIHFPGDYYQYAISSLIASLGGLSSALFGLCVSANFRTMHNITSVVTPWTTVTSLAAGFFVKITSVPIYFQWIKYLSPFYYVFQSLAITQWINVTNIECLVGNQLPCYRDGAAVLESLGFTPSYFEVLKNMLYMGIVSVCWSFIGLFGIIRKNKV